MKVLVVNAEKVWKLKTKIAGQCEEIPHALIVQSSYLHSEHKNLGTKLCIEQTNYGLGQ